jgi:hypothetical protein
MFMTSHYLPYSTVHAETTFELFTSSWLWSPVKENKLVLNALCLTEQRVTECSSVKFESF